MSEHTNVRIAGYQVALEKCAGRRDQSLSELAAARALLREFVDDAFFSCRNVELTEVDGHDWNARVRKHLDASDTLGVNNPTKENNMNKPENQENNGRGEVSNDVTKMTDERLRAEFDRLHKEYRAAGDEMMRRMSRPQTGGNSEVTT